LGHAEVIIQTRQRLGRNPPKHAEGHRTLGGSEGRAAIRRKGNTKFLSTRDPKPVGGVDLTPESVAPNKRRKVKFKERGTRHGASPDLPLGGGRRKPAGRFGMIAGLVRLGAIAFPLLRPEGRPAAGSEAL
jgi:hypothetical protein